MMIFARSPDPDDVILNLEVLYDDPDFLETVSATASRLGRSFRGIDRWQGTQKEVVLRETAIVSDEIISLGAYRQLSDITPLIGTRHPSAESNDEIFQKLTGTAVKRSLLDLATECSSRRAECSRRASSIPSRQTPVASWPCRCQMMN